MRKTFLALFSVLAFAGAAWSQTCTPDPAVQQTGELVSPPPYSDTFQVIATLPACINEPYEQTVTFNIPAQFTFQGLTAPLDSIAIAPTGAISGLPAGLNYLCNPPNCIFRKLTLDCMLIYGTPTSANAPGEYELGILLNVYSPFSPFGPIQLDFPSSFGASYKYVIVVKPTGECGVGTADLTGNLNSLQVSPNPFGQQTTIQVKSNIADEFQFEVFDLTGRSVHTQTVQLTEGENAFTFDAGSMPNGTYYFALSNGVSRVSRPFVVHR